MKAKIGLLVIMSIFFLTGVSLQAQDSPSSQNWQVKIQVLNGNSTKELVFGVHPDASDVYDVDIDEVAPPPGFQFFTAFNIPGFPSQVTKDLRAESDSSHVWTLAILNSGGTTSDICWGDTSFFVDGVPLGSFSINEIDMLSDSCLQVTGDQEVVITFVKAQPLSVTSPDDIESVPKGFGISQNYPNPLVVGTDGHGIGTVIEFQISVENDVTVQIYNILGQKIRTLFDKKMAKGTYEINWDGRDEVGRPLPQGLYILFMRAGAFTDSRKIMLLK